MLALLEYVLLGICTYYKHTHTLLLCTYKPYQAFHYFHPTKSHFKLRMRELRRRRITQKCHLETGWQKVEMLFISDSKSD